MASKIVKVRATQAARDRYKGYVAPVAVFNEQHDDHPNKVEDGDNNKVGLAMVMSDGKSLDVAGTDAVWEAIQSGNLELVENTK